MATITSTTSGNWSDGATWTGGTPPGDGDTADIQNGDTVTIDGDITIGPDNGADPNPEADCSIIVRAGAVCQVTSGLAGDITVELKGPILVEDGGEFLIGTESNPIPSARTVTIDHIGATGWQHWIAGKFAAYGYPNYHMIDEDSQWTRLAADTASGAGVSITVQDAVDWEVGDTVYLGSAGDHEHAHTGCDSTTISAKTSATEYTLTSTSNNHYGGGMLNGVMRGDVIIHGSRNVIFQGTTNQGFSFINYDGTDYVYDAEMVFSWCKFLRGGCDTVANSSYHCVITIAGNSSPGSQADNQHRNQKLQNNVFEEEAVSNGVALGYYYMVPEANHSRSDIENNHVYNFEYGIFRLGYLYGEWRMGHWSFLEMNGEGIYDPSDRGILNIDGFIYSPENHLSSACRPIKNTGVILNNFYIHGPYAGLTFNDTTLSLVGDYTGGVRVELTNGEIFNSNNTCLILELGSVSGSADFIADSIENYTAENGCWWIDCNRSLNARINNCYFDNSNYGSGASEGAILWRNFPEVGFNVHIQNSYFGINSRNEHWNLFVDSVYYTRWGSQSRFLVENCEFKEPTNFDPSTSSSWLAEDSDRRLLWALGFDDLQDWAEQNWLNDKFSLEIVNCKLLDSSGVDQWSTDYPNTDRLGIVHMGGRIHKVDSALEPSGYIDGTIARKLLPLAAIQRSQMTKAVPIKIPLASGESIEVSVQMKKNISQGDGRLPQMHAFGCGINEIDTMADVNNTWDTLTINGTADCSGVLNVWFSCWGERDIHNSSTGAPSNPTNNDYWYAYPIEPGGTGSGVGTPDNLILYVDGFSVSIT